MGSWSWKLVTLFGGQCAPPPHASPLVTMISSASRHEKLMCVYSREGVTTIHVLCLQQFAWHSPHQTGVLPMLGCQGSILSHLGFQLLFIGGIESGTVWTGARVPMHMCTFVKSLDQ